MTLFAVTHGSHGFVAGGEDGTVLVSSNGTDWAIASFPAPARIDQLIFAQDVYVATAYSGRTGSIWSSPDAVTWSERVREYPTMRSVAYGHGRFVVVGPPVRTSKDGATWDLRETSIARALLDVAFGQNTFVGVGIRGQIYQSECLGLLPRVGHAASGKPVLDMYGHSGAVYEIRGSTNGLQWGETLHSGTMSTAVERWQDPEPGAGRCYRVILP